VVHSREPEGRVVINVLENPPFSAQSAAIRVEPVQARSAARVSALLDAACETMHDIGYEQLTTAMVAERAGASIGTVYRYFPDRVAVLQAVAQRNLERVSHALTQAFEAKNPTSVQETLNVVVDQLVEVFRTEKGFRSLRVGDCLDLRPVVASRTNNSLIAEIVREDARQRLGIRLDSEGRLAFETAIDVIDALLARAFLHSDRGEGALIEEARRMGHAAVNGTENRVS
jgi:AcrR family transcriptional regulator